MSLTRFFLTSTFYAQVEKTFKSTRDSFTINYPNDFELYTSKRPEIDFAVKDGYGGSIVINRLADTEIKYYDELTETDYKELIKSSAPNIKVVKFYKTNIGGRKAMVSYTIVPNGNNPVKQINCTIYNGRYIYTITANTLAKYFDKEENIFLKTINSIKFN